MHDALYHCILQDYEDGVNGHKLPTIMPKIRSEQSLQAQDLMLFISHVAAGLVSTLQHLTL